MVADVDSEYDSLLPENSEKRALAITIFYKNNIEVISFVIEVPKHNLIAKINSGELIKEIADTAVDLMYDVAIAQRKRLQNSELH